LNKSLQYISRSVRGHVTITGSKSESNRLLILKNFYPDLQVKNLSDSDDTNHLKEALSLESDSVNIGHAGTAMRFLTAYFSISEGKEVILTGSDRMQNRPIKILVEALQSIGADIEYMDKVGYPPLRIKGKKITNNSVKINGNVSSQYISALILIASSLEDGLRIELVGKVTSIPYIKMTLTLLDQLGIQNQWNGNMIRIKQKKQLENNLITVESDWSSASYFYSLVALSENGKVTLSSYKKNSLQGDNSLVEIYKHFGVETSFNENTISLIKKDVNLKTLSLNLVNSPDLAQTIAVTCFGMGVACDLTGLHTLKIKETDRLLALKNELKKLGADIEVTNNSLHLKASNKIIENIAIETYQDHRMAMAFAPLALKVPISIVDAKVVTKSYTGFWHDLESVMG